MEPERGFSFEDEQLFHARFQAWIGATMYEVNAARIDDARAMLRANQSRGPKVLKERADARFDFVDMWLETYFQTGGADEEESNDDLAVRLWQQRPRTDIDLRLDQVRNRVKVKVAEITKRLGIKRRVQRRKRTE